MFVHTHSLCSITRVTSFALFTQKEKLNMSTLPQNTKKARTILHLRMYWVIWTDDGGFHCMGWESGCFPASVMITWTGLWPSGKRLKEKTSGCWVEETWQTVKTHTWTSNLAVLPEKERGRKLATLDESVRAILLLDYNQNHYQTAQNHFKYWRIRVCDMTPQYNIFHCISRPPQTLTHSKPLVPICSCSQNFKGQWFTENKPSTAVQSAKLSNIYLNWVDSGGGNKCKAPATTATSIESLHPIPVSKLMEYSRWGRKTSATTKSKRKTGIGRHVSVCRTSKSRKT